MTRKNWEDCRWGISGTGLARTALACTFIAFLFPIMNWAHAEHWSFQRFFFEYSQAWIFANTINLLANLVPWVWLESREQGPLTRWATRIGILASLALVGEAISGLIFLLLGRVKDYGAFYFENLPVVVLMTLLVGTAILIYETTRERLAQATLEIRTKELENERALKLATEARLSSLESRLHPHFLFNTLNSISSLIPEDPERAEKLVGQMAALLRFSLDSARHGVVPLDRELKIVKDYLEIEKARLGDRLKYDVNAASDVDSVGVPPLVVQTLVENSIKHAIAPNRAGGWVEVSVTRSNGNLNVGVRDSGPGFDLQLALPGHGLDNLRSRLAALYNGEASLTTSKGEGGAAVLVRIPTTMRQ